MKTIIALVVACLLSACAPKSPVVGSAGCDVWNEAKLTPEGRAVESEYAAGFFDAYSLSHSTRDVLYRWVVDAINLECGRDPSSKIYQAAEKASKRFEE